MKRLIVIGLCTALAACATAQTSVKPAQPTAAETPAPTSATVADINAKLDNAIAIANAGGDAPGAACWTAVKLWVQALPIPQATPALPAPIGASGALEIARIKTKAADAKISALKIALAAGVPDPVHNACAVLWVDAAQVGAKIVGVLGLIPQTGVAAAGITGAEAAAAVLKAQ